MANKKISELTIVTELDGAETLPIVQGTETKKVSIAQIVTKVDSYTKSESDTLLGEKVDKVTGSSLVEDTKVTSYDNHLVNTSNPHGVTASQIGAYSTSESDTLLGEKVSKIGADDIEVTLATKWVILKSTNGTRYKITVNDDGSLQTAGGKHTKESDFKTVGGQSIVGTGDIALNASGETLIDDETESVDSTWSSNNINNNIKKAVLLHEILYHE